MRGKTPNAPWPQSYLDCAYCGSRYAYPKHVQVCVRRGLTGFEAKPDAVSAETRDWQQFRNLMKRKRTGLAELPDWALALIPKS